MNLTPKSWKRSEVEENRHMVEVGTRLIYSDSCNFQRHTVTALDGDMATVIDSNGCEDMIDLSSLQLGWSFSETPDSE